MHDVGLLGLDDAREPPDGDGLVRRIARQAVIVEIDGACSERLDLHQAAGRTRDEHQLVRALGEHIQRRPEAGQRLAVRGGKHQDFLTESRHGRLARRQALGRRSPVARDVGGHRDGHERLATVAGLPSTHSATRQPLPGACPRYSWAFYRASSRRLASSCAGVLTRADTGYRRIG